MQLSDIRTEVRYILREPTASVWSDAEINAEINLAQRYVASNVAPKYLPELIKQDSATGATNTYAYDLDTDYLQMAADDVVEISVSGTANRIFKIVTPDQALLDYSFQTNHALDGRLVCYIANNDINFIDVPTVGASLTWLFVKKPDDLSGDTDESEINDGLIHIVIDVAAANCLKKTNIQKASELMDYASKSIKALQ